ncbi:MAG: arylsulfatase [Lentisphaeria bacterium]|jgi:arylsulfatase A-like enzyme|nr:arylsulfatase [Lentisphaeria bacterium]
MKPNLPNIVLVNVDQSRGDCLGFLGHPTVETPHLDRLAAEGVNFSRAYAGVPSCIAARASLHTGLRQETHGRVGYQDRVPWNYPVTLAVLLAGAGYHTQAVGKMHVFPERSLLGFHNVILHDGFLHTVRHHVDRLELVDDYLPHLRAKYGPEADYADTGLGCNGYVVRPWVYDDLDHPSAWITTQAVDFLRRRDPRCPFFLFLSFHRPHPPLDPPRDYLHMYEGKSLPPLCRGDWDASLPKRGRGLDSPVPQDEWQIDRARRAYYAQLTFIDHQLNRLVHALFAAGCQEDTAILFCADHGDMLYDHGLVAKSLPYEPSARIPFFLRCPRAWGMQAGTSVDAPVELRDVLPTLCDLADVPVPDSIEGRSLLPFCRGEKPDWRTHLHGEHTAGDLSNHWIVDREWKYAWFSQTGREQLFHLAEDPREEHDLAGKRPAKLTEFRNRLVEELRDREEGFVVDDALRPGVPLKSILSHLQS